MNLIQKLKIFRMLTFALILSTIGITSCTTSKTMALNSIELTNQLRPGMTYDEVVEILGNPKSSQMTGDKWVARWNLQEMWKGYIPHDFVFDPKTQTLISWSQNEKAFETQQKQLKVVADALEETAKETETKNTNKSGGGSTPKITNDPGLMQKFAAYYYSYTGGGYGSSGGTERKMTLCANGSYRSSSESSYSGSDWGTVNQGGGDGSWKISGTMEKGTIVLTSNNGAQKYFKYESCGGDCIYFGSVKFGVAGDANCR